MSLPEDLTAFVAGRFGETASLEPIPGDASDRRYYRVTTAEGSHILMQLAERFEFPYVPFARMASFLDGIGLPVPGVREEHPEARVLVVDDVGDCSLQVYLSDPDVDAADRVRLRTRLRTRLYEEAVDWIVRLQRKGTAALTPDVPAYHGCLDDVKFRRELDYFRTHYVSGLLTDPLSPAEGEALERSLATLADEAGRSGNRTLCHRDYHSRNLMIRPESASGSRLAILDFQDARLGPRAYDLASLLCDPYVELPSDLQEAMIHRFLDGIGRQGDADRFGEEYAAVAAQRLLKAIGTFAGQVTRFGNRAYLPYLPRALDRAAENLAELDTMAELSSLLAGPLAYGE